MFHSALSSVAIPETCSIRRLPNPRNQVTKEEMSRFDARTIFYDVFIDASSGELMAIGPPGLNLADYVACMVLEVDGNAIAYQLAEYEQYKLSVLKARIEPAERHHLRFVFDDFSVALTVEPVTLPRGRTVLAAISKNNVVQWVSDWVDFYRGNYSIDDVLVYDNGSDNVEELEQALEGRARVIRWNFPYGPADKRFNKFAQAGALNHCLHRYAKHGTLYNFDIDELLVADRSALEQQLEKSGTLFFNSYLVPYRDTGKATYSYYDFVHRSPTIKCSARKFVCRYEGVEVISQHNTWSWWSALFWKKLRRNKPDSALMNGAYFLHFMGITTKTRPELERFKEADPQTVIFDDSHVRMRGALPEKT